jgi:hypothetical protein
MVANQLYEFCEAVGPEPTRLVLSFSWAVAYLAFSYLVVSMSTDIHRPSCYVHIIH